MDELRGVDCGLRGVDCGLCNVDCVTVCGLMAGWDVDGADLLADSSTFPDIAIHLRHNLVAHQHHPLVRLQFCTFAPRIGWMEVA
jgi:hypothetical protein